MPAVPTDPARSRNPLLLPLIILAVVAVAEGVAIAFLLAAAVRRAEPVVASGQVAAPASSIAVSASSPPASPPAAAPAAAPVPETAPAREPASPQATPAPAPAPARAPAPAHGKVGKRVDSAGFGLTVEKILHEPATYKDMVSIGADERYLAMLVAADNATGHNAQLFPSQFRLQDKDGFGYDPLGIKGTMPALEWRTLGNRETVRGYVDFVVPKSAKDLTLIYTGVPEGGAPISVELGEK